MAMYNPFKSETPSPPKTTTPFTPGPKTTAPFTPGAKIPVNPATSGAFGTNVGTGGFIFGREGGTKPNPAVEKTQDLVFGKGLGGLYKGLTGKPMKKDSGGGDDDGDGGGGGGGGGGGVPGNDWVWGPDGQLLDRYKQNAGHYDTGSLEIANLRQRATDTGPSSWLNMQNQKIDTETMGMRNRANMDATNTEAMGLSNLASSGGLDAGARERLAMSGGANRMKSLQTVSGQGNMAKMGAGLADEEQKLSILQNLPGMLTNQATFRSGIDAGNIQRDYGAQVSRQEDATKRYIGDKMSEATKKSGKKWG